MVKLGMYWTRHNTKHCTFQRPLLALECHYDLLFERPTGQAHVTEFSWRQIRRKCMQLSMKYYQNHLLHAVSPSVYVVAMIAICYW